jgi:hypothetical protein
MGNHLCSLPCVPPVEEPEEDATLYINKVDNILLAINVRKMNLSYQCEEHQLRAIRLAEEGRDKSGAASELRMRNEKAISRDKWGRIYENVMRIRHQMEETVSLQTVAQQYKNANKILEMAIQKMDTGNLELVMEELAENSWEVQATATLLANDFLVTEKVYSIPEANESPPEQQQQKKSNKLFA